MVDAIQKPFQEWLSSYSFSKRSLPEYDSCCFEIDRQLYI